MDAFRLLSRSTSLQKNQNVLSSRPVPSAGAPSHPQILTNIILQDNPIRDSKRKRKPAQTSIPENLKGIDSPYASQSAKSNVSIGVTDLAGKTNVESETHQNRAQILRMHKVKVRVLNSDDYESSSYQDTSSKFRRVPPTKAKFTPVYPQPLQSFQDLHGLYQVSKRLQQNILDQGILSPTEIQLAALPVLLQRTDNDLLSQGSNLSANDVDILTVSPTGSGKTLAFMVSILNGILLHRVESQTSSVKSHISAVVLAPTHELVYQIVNEGRRLANGIGIRITAMRKGMNICTKDTENDADPVSRNSVKCDVLVSTPTLLSNALRETEADTERFLHVSYLVLDEADVLLDPLFRNDVMEIWQACSSPTLQSSLWSATMASSIETLALDYLVDRSRRQQRQTPDPRRIIRIVAGLKDSSLPNVTHKLVYTANEQGKLLALRQILHPSSSDVSSDSSIRPPFLVFTQTIPRAIALHSELLYDIPAEAGGRSRIAVLHADLSLQARSDTMTRFRNGEIWVLITTDILSRGIDFRGINGVVNFDIPSSGALYVHRAGRTGRAGREGGVCCTLYTKEDIPFVKNVANVISTAERMAGKQPDDNDSATPRWLLDALPDLSKATRKELKRRGVVERNTTGRSDGGRRMRISTKSGYERRLKNKRKGGYFQNMNNVDGKIEDSAVEDSASKEDEVFSGFKD